jgi:hypothetical protein
MNVSALPPIAFPSLPAGIQNPFLDMWPKVGDLYKDAMQGSAQDLYLSSARIIQEHTMRALMTAAQSCAEALAQNAANIQQQSLARLADTNQKAAGMMGSAWFDAMTSAMTPAR